MKSLGISESSDRWYFTSPTQLESSLLKPIETEEPEMKVLTLTDLIVDSINNEPDKWTFIINQYTNDSGEDVIEHQNGTKISSNIYYEEVNVISDSDIYLDCEEQSRISEVIRALKEEDEEKRRDEGMKKAMSRFGIVL